MDTQKERIQLFFDGAFGTYYSTLTSNATPCEFANVNDKNTVFNIHRQYIQAGATAIKTNTFGANSMLSSDRMKIENIIKLGYEIACESSKDTDVIVFADIGYINTDAEKTSEEYTSIAETFLKLGAKNFIFETLAEFDVIKPALKIIKHTTNSKIIVSFAVSQDGYTKKGYYYKDLIDMASKNSYVDVVGLNCICGPSHMFSLIKALDLSNIIFSAMPNSGYPSFEFGRTIFRDNAEYFSERLSDMRKMGVSVVGGCCGTTPEHIKLSIEKILGLKTSEADLLYNKVDANQIISHDNQFKEKLLSGKKVIAVEIDPPADTDCTYLTEASIKAAASNVDIITLADSPLARTKADSVMLASKIKREANVEVLPHLSCRDKNHIGIKASLLGANIENINNVLIVTGDPVSQTDRVNYKGVYSFNSFDLISFIKRLNSEVFYKSPFFIGGALNVNVANFDIELKRALKKAENGAEFFLTQPIFTTKAIENLKSAKNVLDSKILAGILPLASYKNALFLNNEVSGIEIPENIITAMKDKDVCEINKISIDFCMSIIDLVKDFCDGYYIVTPLKKIDLVCELIKLINE